MTSVIRWDPFKELEDMSNRMNRLFSRRSFGQDGGTEALAVADWTPSVDVSETEGEYIIKAELPEVRKEDVKVTLEDGLLTIQGERRHEQDERTKKYHRIERSYGRFARTFSVPESVDDAKVKAEYRDGVLSLTLPKAEKAKPRAIEVKVG